jgi:hypothetical protein
VKRAWLAFGLAWGGALAAAPLRAAEPATDAGLLEFLGSVDSSDAGWQEFLAAHAAAGSAKDAGAAPAKPAGSAPAPSATPDATAPDKVKHP